MTKLELIFGIASIIGMIIAIWQTAKAHNQEKELEKYKYLFDLAGKGIEKEKTEEELKILKDEKQKMDEAIKKEIPLKAHFTVISDRLKDDESNLVIYYNRYVKTKQEYDRLSSEEHTEIPNSLIKEIEDQILPDYILKERKESCLRMLTIISYTAALFSAFGITRQITSMLIISSIIPLIRLGKLSFPKEPQKRKEYIIAVLRQISVVITIVLSIITFFYFINHTDHYGWIHYEYEDTFMGLLFGTMCSFLLTIAIHQDRKRSHK